MAPENLLPIEELKRLELRLENARTLGELQPIFARTEEIAQRHSGDFDVQLAAHELKERILALGTKIRQDTATIYTPPSQPLAAPPPKASEPPLPETSTKPIPKAFPVKTTPAPKAAEPVKAPVTANDPPRKSNGVVIMWVLASLVALAIAGIAFSVFHDRGDRAAAANTPVDVPINTNPPGASISINDQATCISNCVAHLLPGTYQVSASIDGYDATKAEFTVSPGETPPVELKLQPQAPRIRVVAELREGQVFLDDKLAGELQDGSFTIEQVAPGTHTLRIVGGGSEAGFQFSAEPGAIPTVQGPISTKDLLAAVVGNAGGQARMVTSAGPLKLAVNGAEHAPATTEGVDLAGYRTGTDEFVLTEGTKDRTLSETFGAGAGLTVFLQTDQNIGTLVIATGQDDVRVFLNDKESKRRTQRGELRVQTVGKVNVRVAKDGFEEVPAQVANVEKGAEAKLTFAMKATPQFSSIVIMGGTPGSDVLLDQRMIGTIAPDGTFRNSSVPVGDHAIDLRRDQYEPKHLTKTFRGGQTITIAGTEGALTALRVATPAQTPSTAAPKGTPESAAKAAPAPAKVASGGDISNFDIPSAWKEQDGIWRHQGAATLTYGLKPNGVLTFSIYLFRGGNIFKGGRVRWFLNYTNAANYSLFELDEDTFWAKTVTNGKTVDRKKVGHKQDKSQRVWNIQIDVSPTHMIHKIQGDNGWVELDNWSDPARDFTQGKFGILVNGNDEIGLSNFHFTGR